MADSRTTAVLPADLAADPAAELTRIQDSRRAALNLMEDAVQALRLAEQSEKRYRTLFDSIDEGFCIIEKVEGEAGAPLDFRYVEANPAFAANAGVDGVVGQTIRSAFPDEPEEWYVTYDAIVRTGEPIRFERGLVSQGRVLELYAFRVDDDTHRRVAVIFKDITTRKRVEEALRQSEERYRSLMQAITSVIWTTDADGRFIAEQPAWSEYTGQTWEEHRDFGWTNAIHPDDRGQVLELWETARAARSLYKSNGRLWHAASGTYRHFEARGVPVLNTEGSVREWIGQCSDIDDRRRSQQALTEADRRKDEFLALLGHELRNPLAPILVSIEVLRRAQGLAAVDDQSIPASDELHRRADHALDVLRRQVGQMVRLVDDLLDASRISRGKIGLRKERVELSSVLSHAVEAVRSMADGRTQELTVTLPAEPTYVNADPTRLAQIVGNLLNNACKFTDRGGHIWLTVDRSEHPGRHDVEGSDRSAPHVAIRVRDTGIGIAAENIAHVFDMFTQVDTSLERSLTGLGIGLTLVKTLAEMHGGSVEVSSAGVGQGTEFIVRLPLDVATQAPDALATTTEPAVATPLRILIVDDNRDSADMLAILLKLMGHETHTAHDGVAAVGEAARIDPDVVVLDIGLPLLNGYDAARKIREQHGDKGGLLLVALTGWGQEEDRRRSEEAGFDAHVVKPVDIGVLTRLLGEFGAGKAEDRD